MISNTVLKKHFITLFIFCIVFSSVSCDKSGDNPDCADRSKFTSQAACGATKPDWQAISVQVINPGSDVDDFSVSLAAGAAIFVQLFAAQTGSSLDPELTLLNQADGSELASNDDTCGNDSFVQLTATTATDLVIRVSGYSGSTGWYGMSVVVDGVRYVADAANCSDLELGGSSFTSGSFFAPLAAPLIPEADHYPLVDAAMCTTDCSAMISESGADVWIERFSNGPPAVCSN